MRIDLTGRRALVTGSTKGIGFAAAQQLAQAGAHVVVNGRGQAAVEEATAAIAAAGGSVEGVAADVSEDEGRRTLAEAAPDVDILINNAGVFGFKDFFETPDDEWLSFFRINVLSGVRLARTYLPGMMRRGKGRVVFISSEAALNIPPDSLRYAATKTANLSIARGLAKRVAGSGVTVNSVLPGPTLSEGVADMLLSMGAATPEDLEEVADGFAKTGRGRSLIERMATPKEVASMILYLSSDAASATTGAALRVDGGVVDMI